MPVDAKPLQMVRLSMDLPAMLRHTGLPPTHGALDLGYLVHWHLVSAFGECAPRPFALRGELGRQVRVFGYGNTDAERLLALARESDAKELIDLRAIETRAMPGAWRVGARFGFEVRICPIVRRSNDGPGHRRGSEVDAFLAACEASAGKPVDRIAVYRDWLAAQFQRSGGSCLLSFESGAFRRSQLHRRTQGDNRRARSLERPDFVARGTLSITDAVAFDALVRRGVGRHRAFGFGMLLLRRAE